MSRTKLYSIADVTIGIFAPWEIVEPNDFPEFEVESAEPDYSIFVHKGEAGDFPAETDYVIRKRSGNIIDLFYKPSVAELAYPRSVLADAGIDALLAEHDAFILHSSYIGINGKALLFSAPSGTGKSTQADFWHNERGAEIINGDRSIVSLRNGRFFANGCFFSGSSGFCKNITLPLHAVVLLGQAERNIAERAAGLDAFIRILKETPLRSMATENVSRVTGLIEKLIAEVKIIDFRCENDPNTVEYLEKYL